MHVLRLLEVETKREGNMAKSVRLSVALTVLVAFAIALAVACTKEVVKEVPVEKQVIVEKEVVKIERVEVPVETIVEVVREVVKEVEVEVPVIVEKEVVREVEVPVEVIVEKQVIKEVEVPGETIIVEKEVIQTVLVEKIVTLVATPEARVMEFPVPGSVLVIGAREVGPAIYHRPAATNPYYNMGMHTGIGETLMDWDGANYFPMVAASWEIVELDGEEGITWTLQRGIPWHDASYGTVKADDVLWTYQENMREGTLVPHPQWMALDFTDMRVLDENTVRWDWDQPTIRWPFLSRHFPHGETIMNEQYYQDKGEDFVNQMQIGTGPFRLISHTSSDLIIVEAVKNHYRRPAAFETVRILEVPEVLTRVAMMDTGQIDVTGIDLPQADLVQEIPGVRLSIGSALPFKVGPTIHVGGNWLIKVDEFGNPADNTPLALEKPYVGDPDDPADFEKARLVRWAMSLAINRPELNEVVLGGLACVDFHMGMDTCNPNWNPAWGHEYGTEEWGDYDDQFQLAKDYLEEAGYPDGFEFTFWTPTNQPGVFEELCEAIAGYWTKLGLDVNIDDSAYQVRRPEFVQLRSMDDVWCFGWAGDVKDPMVFLDIIPTNTFGRQLSNLGHDFPEAYDIVDRLQSSATAEEAWAGPLADWHAYMAENKFTFGTISYTNPVAIGPAVGNTDMEYHSDWIPDFFTLEPAQ